MKVFLRFIQSRLLLLSFLAVTCAYAHGETGDIVFSETFEGTDSLKNWTIIDNNGGRSWEYRKGTAAYMLDYATGLPADDWCISPEFNLAADRVYEFKFDLEAASKPENLKVFLGTSTDTASFTTEIADFYHVTKADMGTKSFKIYVKADGVYRLGFYAYSDAKMYRVSIDNIYVTDISAATVPGPVTDLKVTPAEQGGMSATVSFKSPSITANNEEMTGTCDISIYRNNEETAATIFSSAESGKAIEWNDNEPVHGWNTYKVVAQNNDGAGEAVKDSVFVGLDQPNSVTNVIAKLNSDKSITVTWDAPTSSVNGGYVDFDNITYIITRGETSLATYYETTSYTDKVPVERGQALVSYTVTPVAATEKGVPATSSSVVTGIPLVLPYQETFANQATDYPWFVDGTNNAFDWHTIGDDEEGQYEEIMTQDSDNGMIVAESRRAASGATSRYVSPLIDLSTAVNPVLKFWFYEGRSPWYDPEYEGEVRDRVQVQISFEGGEWANIDNAVFYQNNSSSGWVECEVSLPRQEASFANIAFLATADADDSAYRNMYIDNISIDEAEYANDLVMKSLTVDNKRVSINESQTYTAEIFNRGGSTASGYTVDFYCDGSLVATVNGDDVAAANTAMVAYKTVATPADAQQDEHLWVAKVNYEADEMSENNVSDTLATSVRSSELPAVSGLAAVGEVGNVSLTWNAAASVAAVEHTEMTTVTDDFESYEPYIIDGIGDWTMFDGDGATTLVTPRIPLTYNHQGEPMAFQVFNTELSGTYVEENLDVAFMPVDDGSEQMLICPSVDWPAENDDWLITPRLDGRKQTVSFYAKSASYDSEWINVYYSTTDSHHDSFVKLNTEDQLYVWDGWAKYEYEVPEGARYFAVRCVRRGVILMIDDFTYAPYDGYCEGATLLGYNVYKNGVKVNSELVTSSSYIDTETTDGNYVYTVTAVYDCGESGFSNEATLVATGIEAVGSDTNATEAAVFAIDGKRVASPVRGINIVRMSDGTVRKTMKK